MANIIRMWVYDRPGVLDRITGLIRRHGVNINTVTSGHVAEGTSQITISLGEPVRLDALGDRFSEMNSVRHWEKCTPATHIIRELLLARFTAEQKDLIDVDMRVVREEDGMTFAEYVGEPCAVDAMIKKLQSRDVICTRAGALGLALKEGGM